MPPKAADKKAAKIIEDKTFGLKNKNKSKKVQQYVQQVTVAAKSRGKSHREMELEQQAKEARKLAKKLKEDQEAEMGALFKAVAVIKQQEVADNVDPKSVICAFFKAGTCKRGNKCKYSHDMAIERKTQKINLYADPRESMESGDWDQAKLESVVAQKYVKKPTETEIVCKYFLDAVEGRKYGWLWECPNGERCHYRHALPPGYMLKSQQAEEKKEEEEQPDIGELIELERQQLDFSKCTPVTLDSFKAWKERKKKQREAEFEEKRKEAAKKTGGKGLDVLSGRALFMYDPSLFVDDDEAAAEDEYEIKETAWADEVKMDALYEVDAQDEDEQPDQQGAGAGKPAADAAVGDASLFLDDDTELPDD